MVSFSCSFMKLEASNEGVSLSSVSEREVWVSWSISMAENSGESLIRVIAR